MSKFLDKLNRIIEQSFAKPKAAEPKADAPAATPKPKPKPAPAPAKPKPSPDPEPDRKWRPKPGPRPKPKAEVQVMFIEAYEDEAHPATIQFWRDLPKGTHKFAKHPIMAIYGKDLSKAGYEHTKARIDKIGTRIDPMELYRTYVEITQIESDHKEELEQTAKELVSKIWGIPIEMLEPELTSSVDVEEDKDDEERELHPELEPEVLKRITMNTLSQGAAVHSMMSLHHMAKKKIAQISPDLLEQYDKISAIAHGTYWLIDIAAMAENLAQSAVGSSKIEFDDDDGPIVQAKGVIFPVLVQELVKGAMEVLTYHHLSELDPEVAEEIIRHADKLQDEPFQIQVGPELWRRLLAVANSATKGTDIEISDVIAALSVRPPEEVHNIITLVLDEKPDEAAEMIRALVEKTDESDFEPEYEEYDDAYDEPEY